MSAQGRIGEVSGTVAMPSFLTRVGQMKLASDPESNKTGTWSWFLCHVMRADKLGWEVGGWGSCVAPVRITDGRCLLTDTWQLDVLSPHSTNKGVCLIAVASH